MSILYVRMLTGFQPIIPAQSIKNKISPQRYLEVLVRTTDLLQSLDQI